MWVNPAVGPITSGYGMRRHPITGNYQLHSGTDVGAPSGVPIWAASEGTVTYSAFHSGGGNMVKIAHAGGIETWYLHMTARHVAVGNTVRAGQQIGTVGSTGNSTGPHLHFETRVNGSPQDPIPFMRARGVNLGSGVPTNPTPEEDDMTPDQALKLDQIWSLLGADGALNTPANSSVIAHVRATVDLLRQMPNSVWMAPVIGHNPDGAGTETHPAAAWLTVMAYRIGALAARPQGEVPTDLAATFAESLPDDVAKAVHENLTARLSA